MSASDKAAEEILCQLERRPRPLMVDLCCGFGGASAAARDRGWRVITLDIEPYVKPGIIGDLRALPLRPGLAPDLLWISPCCREFTKSRLPWFKGVVPDLGLMRAAVSAIEYLTPRSFVIENVPAAVRWVRDFMGAPTQKVWAHVFWSNLPALLPQVLPHKMRIPGNCKFTHFKRSLIPYGVAHAFTLSAERRCRDAKASDNG